MREALSYALDKESILKYRLRSDELPASGLFLENSLYFHPELISSPYNKEVAKSLLKESGIQIPVKLTLTVSSSNKTNIEIAKTIAINLKDVGFDVKVENLENSVFFQHVNRGLTQMWLAPWVGYKDPDHLRFIFGSNMFPPAGANRGHYSNPKVDVLLEEGRIEFNAQKRKEIYLQAQEIIANDMPYIYLWHGTNVAVTSKRVHGYDLYADGHYWSLIKTTIDEQK
jgi:peptide/nickel transport system substrate-binding protein